MSNSGHAARGGPTGVHAERGGAEASWVPGEGSGNNVVMTGSGVIKVKGKDFSLTTACIQLQEAAYQNTFHQPLGSTYGSLIDSNLLNFQKEFALKRKADARSSVEQLCIAAVQEVSFGKSRLELGYNKFEPKPGGLGKVDALGADLKNIDVPLSISFVARK